MVRDQGVLALGGPLLVEAVIGEKISEQDLGGADVHLIKSGVAHMGALNDEEALHLTRRYLSFFPSSSADLPLRIPSIHSARASDELLKILPDDSSAFDMNEVLAQIVDPQSVLPFMPDFGKSLITCLARIGGYSVGIVASQSNHLGGVLETGFGRASGPLERDDLPPAKRRLPGGRRLQRLAFAARALPDRRHELPLGHRLRPTTTILP